MTDARTKRPASVPIAGLVSGTMVETGDGWRPVESLVPGDRVHTMDGSKRTLRGLRRRRIEGDIRRTFPGGLVLVPGGALGNCEAFYLLPETLVLLSGPVVEGLSGESAAFVGAGDMVGHGGIARTLPVDEIEIVAPVFADAEIVYVNTGVLVRCAPPGQGDPESRAARFPVLRGRKAAVLLACTFVADRMDGPDTDKAAARLVLA